MTTPHPLLNPSSRWYYPLRWLILLGLGLAIYYQTFKFDFIFDDYIFIVTDPFIKNFDRINDIWVNFPRTRTLGMYSFAFNYLVNNLHPKGYHIFNFVVHCLAVILVWGVAGLLFKIVGWGYAPVPYVSPHKKAKMVEALKPIDWLRPELPFIIAVIFLVHPGQTQAITYISQRFESMATVFYLATMYCYLKARLSFNSVHQFILFVLAGLCAVLGIMTKEVVATVPVMILAAEWIFWGQGKKVAKPNKKAKPENYTKIYWIIGIAGVFFALLFMKFVHAGLNIFLATVRSESHDGDILTAKNYFLTQMRVFLTFMRLLILPIHQNLEYDYPMSTGLFHPLLTVVGIGVMGVVAFLAVRLRRIYPLIAFGLAWILISFSINMAPRSNVIFEHKLYLLSFGFILAAVVGLSMVIKDRKILAAIFVGIIAILSIMSFQRNQVWRSELVLWEDVVKKSPNKARVNSNLGRSYGNLGRYDESIKFFTKAVELNPKDDISFLDRGVINFKLGHRQAALDDFSKAIAISPNYFSTYIKRSWLYKAERNYEAALADLNKAIQLEPKFQYGYTERGVLFMQMNRKEESLQDLNQALAIAPGDYDASLDRGVLYYAMGQYQSAIEDFNHALAVNPNALVYKNRGYAFLGLNRMPEAMADFEMVIRLDPNDAGTKAKYMELSHSTAGK